MARMILAVVFALTLAGCAGSNVDISSIPELPPTTSSDVETLVAGLPLPPQNYTLVQNSDVPVVLNVWASWCVPCRSEGPLLAAAAAASPQVRFVGLNVRDDQTGAREFIAEFFADAPLEHLFDAAGNIPVDLGGSRGVPLTFFYAPGGELVELHTGVIDERTLALQIDEIKSR